jgi:hypothetical protein
MVARSTSARTAKPLLSVLTAAKNVISDFDGPNFAVTQDDDGPFLLKSGAVAPSDEPPPKGGADIDRMANAMGIKTD